MPARSARSARRRVGWQASPTHYRPDRGVGQRRPSRPKAVTRPVFKAQLTHPHKSRMQFPQNPHPHWAQNGRISTIRFHNLKYLEGNCMRNVSPADERRPQGLRAHIHTLTMKAFSDSSAKKSAQHGASSGSSAKNSPSTPPPPPHPVENSPGTPPSAASPVQNSPCTPLLTACAGQNSPCSPKMAQFCAFCPRMANFLPLSPPTSHAGRTFSRSHPHQAEQENSSCELSRL